MPSHGYSDRVNHAFAFAAKHLPVRLGRRSGLSHLTQPANVAVILSHYDCDEHTIVAGILRYLIEEAPASSQAMLETKIGEKFGPVVMAVLLEVVEPRYDERGKERPWQACKMDYLATLASAEPRSLDVCTAGEIHLLGSLLTDVRRLGAEYVSTFTKATATEILWWYQSMIGALESHREWPRRAMVKELRDLAAELGPLLNDDTEV